MPRVYINHDELAMDGRVRSIHTEIPLDRPAHIVHSDSLVIIRVPTGQNAAEAPMVIIPIHALRMLRYDPYDELETEAP